MKIYWPFNLLSVLPSIALGALLVLLLAFSARAEQSHLGYYSAVSLGVPVPGNVEAEDDLGRFNLDSDPGYALAVSFGVDLAPTRSRGRGRVELEYCYRSNGLNEAEFSDQTLAADGDLVVQSLMLNSFAVPRDGGKLRPYFGLGIGAAQLKADNLKVGSQPMVDDDDLTFAWQLGCGLEMDISPTLRLDIGYRYFNLYQPELSEADGRPVDIDYAAHSGMLGLVYLF